MKTLGIVGHEWHEGIKLISLFKFLGFNILPLPQNNHKIKDDVDAIVITGDQAFIDELILHYKNYDKPVHIDQREVRFRTRSH